MGYLRLIIGPMWSSKSTTLLAYHRKYHAIGKNALLINHASDLRYIQDGVCTHDGQAEQCHMVNTMADVVRLPEYATADMVLVNEGQFFPDLLEVVTRECDATDKIFIVCGLAGGYARQPVGQILQLIPHAEAVEKLEGFCQECADGTPGPFTKRKAPLHPGESLVGGGDHYKCVCREHFLT
jgi:thymidine kinase